MLLAAVLVTGCGGSGAGETGTGEGAVGRHQGRAAPSQAYVRGAEAICAKASGEARRLRRKLPQAFAGGGSPEEALTNGLVRPGLAILRRQAAGLEDLRPAPPSHDLQVYLGLFEPILVLGRQRLEAGVASDPQRSHELELLLVGLSQEQSRFAQRIGLRSCAVSFFEALGGRT